MTRYGGKISIITTGGKTTLSLEILKRSGGEKSKKKAYKRRKIVKSGKKRKNMETDGKINKKKGKEE